MRLLVGADGWGCCLCNLAVLQGHQRHAVRGPAKTFRFLEPAESDLL